MLLVIDVGNTNSVFGLYQDQDLVGTFRLRTDAAQTSDEIGMKILQYYNIRGFRPEETTAVMIASVVPPAMYSLTNAIRKYFNLNPVVIGKDVDPGILNLYINPREVGIDRLVNAVSAIEKYGKPLIIVDIGTATTFDCIDEHGAYLGGAIFPGIKVAMEALFMKASKLPRVDITRPDKAIGRTTVQSMQSGAVRGYVGALTGIITDMKKEMAPGVKVIATGGMGRMMAEYCPLIDEVDSNLTLDAMRMIYERNQKVFENRRFDASTDVEATEESN